MGAAHLAVKEKKEQSELRFWLLYSLFPILPTLPMRVIVDDAADVQN